MILKLNNHDTRDAHPLAHIQDVLDWYAAGIEVWTERYKAVVNERKSHAL